MHRWSNLRHNLTAMRMRLEAMHTQQTENAEEVPAEATDEVEEAVRHRFTTTMEKTAASDQLNRIESLLLEQRGILQKATTTWACPLLPLLTSAVGVHRLWACLLGPVPLQPSVHSLSQRLSLSSSSVLRRLSSLLLQLADNRGSNRSVFIPHLDAVLSEVFQSEESPKEFQRQLSPENSQVIIDQQDTEGQTDAIEQLLDELRKEVRNTSTVDEQTAERFRALTVSRMSDLFPTVSIDVFDSQLGAQIQDSVSQYVGIGVEMCEENLIFEVEELLKNELSYYQLMNSLNTISDS